jgi:hypothetical protein
MSKDAASPESTVGEFNPTSLADLRELEKRVRKLEEARNGSSAADGAGTDGDAD